ncbi:response regulator [Aeromicrobium alkaliterrae]|uniref:response regulator n=1 Tax=Aeromicrobium alkaliterrae TaxID=302168 RepID=UPI0031E46B82
MAHDRPLRVLVYSDDRDVRHSVLQALGPRPHPDLPSLEFLEVATEAVVLQHLDERRESRRVDLVILDGESVPVGGLGIARQIKDEIFHAPPVVVVTGRPGDAWLAHWSRADAVTSHPIDPLTFAETVIGVIRTVVAQTS